MSTNAALFVDVSDNDPPHSLKAHWLAGHRLLVVKVTQGTAYTWALSHDLAEQWHSFGPDAIVGHYEFLQPGNVASGANQADYFWTRVKDDVRAGDVLICDTETNGETGAEHASFCAQLRSHTDLERWTYGSPYFLRSNGIKAHGTLLWLAEYGPRIAFIPPSWTTKTLVAWQFTDKAANVAGMASAVDMSRLLIERPAVHGKPKAKRPPKIGPVHRAALKLIIRWKRDEHVRAGELDLVTGAETVLGRLAKR